MRFLRFLLAGLLLLAGGGQAHASGDFSDWPRMDVLELLSPTRALVEELLAEGYIVDTEHVEFVRVYATEEQRRAMDERRIPYMKVGQQPDPPALNEKANHGEHHN